MGIISRLVAQDGGSIDFQDRDISAWKSKELSKRLAILTQTDNIQMKLTIRELVTFGRFSYSARRNTAENERIIAQDTKYVLLDEPTNNLDIYHASNMMKIIRHLCDELGKTVILVLHKINYAAFYSDCICAFQDGKVFKFGIVEEVMSKENLAGIYNMDFEIMKIEGRPLSIYY